jgi:DNA-binding MarR family transcriptional regulator
MNHSCYESFCQLRYCDGVPSTPRPARVGFLLSQLGSHAAAAFADRTREIGITPAQAGVLRILGRQPGINQRDLARRLGAVQSRVVVLIDGLESAGHVVRERSSTDRRNYELRLTEQGTATLARLRTIAETHEAELTTGLTDEQRATLADLLATLATTAGLDVEVHPGYRARSAAGEQS